MCCFETFMLNKRFSCLFTHKSVYNYIKDVQVFEVLSFIATPNLQPLTADVKPICYMAQSNVDYYLNYKVYDPHLYKDRPGLFVFL